VAKVPLEGRKGGASDFEGGHPFGVTKICHCRGTAVEAHDQRIHDRRRERSRNVAVAPMIKGGGGGVNVLLK